MELFEYIVFIGLWASNSASSSPWHYVNTTGMGPSMWYKNAPMCNGMKQSPIDIKGAKPDVALKQIKMMDNWNNVVENMTYTLENDGHSVKVKLEVDGNYVKSPIKTDYNGEMWRLVQFHLHWGESNSMGSEHTIDGMAYPVELHMIHTNWKYETTIGDAIKEADGLMVLGFLFEEKPAAEVPDEFKRFFDTLSNVTFKGQTTMLNPFPTKDMVPPSFGTYYTYPGSLTTPTCDESVKWVVFKDVVPISSAMLMKLRALNSKEQQYYTDNNMTGDAKALNRFRPVQMLNGRNVTMSPNFSVVAGSSVNMNASLVVSVVCFIVTFFYSL